MRKFFLVPVILVITLFSCGCSHKQGHAPAWAHDKPNTPARFDQIWGPQLLQNNTVMTIKHLSNNTGYEIYIAQLRTDRPKIGWSNIINIDNNGIESHFEGHDLACVHPDKTTTCEGVIGTNQIRLLASGYVRHALCRKFNGPYAVELYCKSLPENQASNRN